MMTALDLADTLIMYLRLLIHNKYMCICFTKSIMLISLILSNVKGKSEEHTSKET